jgi:hypothetical protein
VDREFLSATAAEQLSMLETAAGCLQRKLKVECRLGDHILVDEIIERPARGWRKRPRSEPKQLQPGHDDKYWDRLNPVRLPCASVPHIHTSFAAMPVHIRVIINSRRAASRWPHTHRGAPRDSRTGESKLERRGG